MRHRLIDWNKIDCEDLGDHDIDDIFNAIEEQTSTQHYRGRYKIEYDHSNSCSIWSSHGQVLARVGTNMIEIRSSSVPDHFSGNNHGWLLIRNQNLKRLDVFLRSCYLTTPHKIRLIKKRNNSIKDSYVLYANGEPIKDYTSIFITKDRISERLFAPFNKKQEVELFSWVTVA